MPGLVAHAEHQVQGHRYLGVKNHGSSQSHQGDVYAETVNYNYCPNDSRPEGRIKRWEDFKKCLTFDRMEVRRRAIEPAYGDTCRWVLDTKQYLRWRDEALQSEHHGFLWIKGKPGVGKSTIMKFLLEHAQASMPKCTILSFFFNARGSSLETSAQGLYRSLLLQLLDKSPMLQQAFELPQEIPARNAQEPRWEVDVVQDLFREALILSRQRPVVLFIDALDEGNGAEVRDMVQYITKLASNARSLNFQFHICFASRHYPSISNRFSEELIVENQKHHREDIRRYVSENLVPNLKTKRIDLVSEVIAKSQEVFLWIILVVRTLNDQFDKGSTSGQLNRSLSKTPHDLEKLLADILWRGASDNYLVPALKWIVAGTTECVMLTVESLYFAILFEVGELTKPTWDPHEVDVGTMKRFILQTTKGLVELVRPEDQHDGWTVQLIHESVRQHLVDGGLTTLDTRFQSEVEARCHAEVAECCQAYVRLIQPADLGVSVDVNTGTVAIPQRLSEGEKRNTVNQKFPLINYALDNTLFHAEAAHRAGVYTMERLDSFPLREWINISRVIDLARCQLLPSTSLLFLLIQRNCFGLAQDLLQWFKTFNSENLDPEVRQMGNGKRANVLIGPHLSASHALEGLTCLILAVRHGEIRLVHLLLECGADVNVGTRTNPLMEAVWNQSIDVARLLLNHGADVNAPNEEYGSALGLAAFIRNPDIMSLLLQHGANDNVMNDWDGNILTRAARENHPEIVKLLIQHGANVNVVAGEYGTALAAAVFDSNYEMVTLLLKHGANINQSSSDGVNFALRAARLARRHRTRLDEYELFPRVVGYLMVDFLVKNGATELKRSSPLIGENVNYESDHNGRRREGLTSPHPRSFSLDRTTPESSRILQRVPQPHFR